MINPGRNYVVVRRINNPKKLDSLFLPDDNGFISQQGRVMAVGSENKDGLAFGDHVIFIWSAGFEFTIKGTKLLIMKHDDILAVVEEPVNIEAHHREF